MLLPLSVPEPFYSRRRGPGARFGRRWQRYCTATVTVSGELADPMLIWTGTAGPGATPGGTCALICRTPETKPGAAPSKLSGQGRPPMVTETLALGAGNGAEATNPSTLAGVVKPAPVAKMLTQSPRAAGFTAEFTVLSRAFKIAPGPRPEPATLKTPGAVAATCNVTGLEN